VRASGAEPVAAVQAYAEAIRAETLAVDLTVVEAGPGEAGPGEGGGVSVGDGATVWIGVEPA
jgi:hypothetical protein